MRFFKKTISALLLSGLLISSAWAKQVNINTASAEEIAEALSGIGDSTAAAIIDYRNANGPFASLDDLTNVKGIGAATVDKNKADILFGNAAASNLDNLLTGNTAAPAANIPSAIDINTASAETLSAGLAGVGASTAQAIVAYRNANGPFNSVDELANVKGIGAATIEKNRAILIAGAGNNNGGNLLDDLFAPQPTANTAASNASQTGSTVDINTATAEQLAANLSGVGAATAQAIVTYRNANGPFANISDLTNVKGIGAATIEKNAAILTASNTTAAPANSGNLLDDLLTDNTAATNQSAAAPVQSGIVNLNTASAEMLAANLSGVGMATAEKIVAYRQANGGFTAIEELANVSGIGPATVAANLNNMVVGVAVEKGQSSSKVELTGPINVNTASLEQLQALTFIGPVKAQRIIEYRQTQGRIDSLEELMSIKGIGEKTIERNRQWIQF